MYEPPGSEDSWQAVGDEPVVLLVTVKGAIESLDDRGQVLRGVTTANRLETDRRWCQEHGSELLATLE
ncbi:MULTISPECIES: hypothetical protein [Corallococcus]|uniref:hypothetical protein n=1 Tax=Corallococcus TaxID=83461 RepID=UPI001F196C59|nr:MULTISPECIES: hypothetical protein [Corallococcus]